MQKSCIAPKLLAVAAMALGCSGEAAQPPSLVASAGAASTAGAGAGTGGGGAAGAAGAATGGGSAGDAGGLNTLPGGASGAGGANGAGGAGGAPAELFDWNFYGRWDLTHPGKAVTVNSAAHVTASFHGSGISAKFDISTNTGAIPTVSFRIDEGELVDKELSATLPIASGLPVKDHTLTLFVRGMSEYDQRWTPPLVASTTFLGFAVDGGTIVPSPRPKRLKIEFLGDSITEGVSVHDKGPDGQASWAWRCDGPRNYASLTAMALGAEWRQVGFGYQGLSKGGNGGVPNAGEAFNWFYAGVPRDDWQADLVVINQGTNDRPVGGAAFAPLYASFLELVRSAYPKAKIVGLRPFNGTYADEIHAEVSASNAAGDQQVYYVDTEGWTQPADFTDGGHPNVSGSIVIRDRLVPALKALL